MCMTYTHCPAKCTQRHTIMRSDCRWSTTHTARHVCVRRRLTVAGLDSEELCGLQPLLLAVARVDSEAVSDCCYQR